MKDTFITIKESAEGLYKDKGSKFYAFAYPVNEEEEVKTIMADLRKRYHDASHHCFAWRLGASHERYRSNDDGEPSGSAGKPILGQIQSRSLTNVLVVVVRYFGGTLLGVGGLINAYRSAASLALNQTPNIKLKVYTKLKVDFEYAKMNSVMKLVKDFHMEFEDQQFDLACSLILRVWIRDETKVVEKLGMIEGCKVLKLPG